jgi:hypothetical protein
LNNIGHTIYTTICHYAEGGKRVCRVELPPALYEEYEKEPGLTSMYRTLKVEIVERKTLKAPKFIVENGGGK